ncbi:uncharacterized protein MEPE_02858 [Melanopsichium pennsylvanicum]|uniref:Uncharacterized protein n=2 Tax=Melanopsichium pennsylvanicum TaxID=63383 RepID=A0AAJ5C4X9_9BASI|nr:putative protein [Melanopsichium pennsylvanicum 4]SNX84150.1 uncharacterized protein MEPE_02858 [Melanopsichium pennsylvanicum]
MSSTATGAAAAGSSGGLSTLSTSLLAAACIAVAAAAIFVIVALRRYLRAKQRKSLIIAASPPPASAAAIYASHVKAKSISPADISEPRLLSFAPEQSHIAQHDVGKTSLAQRTAKAIRQSGFFAPKPFASPKFPNAALLSPRMQPPVSADLPPPRTPCTPKSPGLTELAMSPGPSILLKPIAYGKSPKLSSPSTGSINEKRQESSKKKATRSAVPSLLLRSLGVLPDFTASSSQPILQEEQETLANEEDKSEPKEAEEPSLTPILDLGIDFGNDMSFEQSLKLRGDFSFGESNDAWLNSSTPAKKTEQSQAKKSAGMQSLIQALSPAQPDVTTLPGFKTSPPTALTGLPSPAFARSHLPTPPPSAGLPPAPTSASMYKTTSNSSLQSKASRATTGSEPAMSTNTSVPDSFHSATGSIGAICINMGPIDALPSPRLCFDDEQQTPSYRPLSLGLGPAKSPSQNTFNNILGTFRKAPSRSSEDLDLEAANFSTDESSIGRSYSSDDISYSSSQTSFSEANTSISKANIVPAASIPPLPPMPISLLKQAKSTAVFKDEDSSADIGVLALSQTRKRASTLGALERPKLTMPDLMHPRAAPTAPSDGTSTNGQELIINIESVQVNRASLLNLKSKSSDHLPLKTTGKAAMKFKSPYHRTLIPDPPMDGAHLSPGLGADSPIFAQLSPKMRGMSPSLSPKPGFAESLKARLSLSRKSLTSSPGFASRNSTPRLSTINAFPKPDGENFTEGEIADSTNVAQAETTPKIKPSKPSKPAKAATRPVTSPLIGQQAKDVGLGFSPAILFNGQEMEPTKPLRFKKPSSAGGRLGGSPSPMLSPASPSPMLHTGPWESSAAEEASPSEALFSPLIAENATTPSGERIEFSMAQSPSACSTPAAPSMPTYDLPSLSEENTPQLDQATPRPDTNQAGVVADEELELEHLSYRDSMISVAASTISMMSNSTCMSEAMGEDLDAAADRRAKLLASVQQNLLKAQAKDAKRDSHAANRYRQSKISMSQSSSLRNIPEEVSGGVQTMGLGLFESEEEEERETLEDSPKSAAEYSLKKPNHLILMPQHDSRLIGPLTPPLTPVDATAMQKQSRHVATPSTSSASSASSNASVPRRMRPSHGGGLAPIDTHAANRLSPAVDQRDGASSPSSLKLRPLSLAASLHSGDGSPMKRFERPAFSPALSANIPSPGPVHVAGLNERSSRYNEEGRSSRNITYRQGGVLPTISSKGALDTGRAGHVEPSLVHSDSTTSMGSISSSLGSFSRMGNFPSPVRSSFTNQVGLGKAMGMRSAVGSRGSVMSDMPEMPCSSSNHSLASSTTGSRLGYKTSDLSVGGM